MAAYAAFADTSDWAAAVLFPILYSAAAVIVAWTQFFGDPIVCIAPPNVTRHWVSYAEASCWARGSYVDGNTAEWNVASYHWTVLFLLISAAAFTLPNLLFLRLGSTLGTQVIRKLNILRENDWETVNLSKLIVGLDSSSNTLIYLGCKWFQTVVLWLEFAVLCHFMGVSGHHGWTLLNDLVSNTQYQEASGLPLRLRCPLELSVGGRAQSLSLLCVVRGNMVSVQLLTLLWFSLVVLLLTAAVELVGAHVEIWVRGWGSEGVLGWWIREGWVEGGGGVSAEVVERVAEELGPDGLLLLRLVHRNVAQRPAQAIALAAFANFRRETKIETLIT